ncbi:MAG: QueT transporter family protein [Lachnospiraceae bacterium]|nr:QueT transporter family protein [Lachnospiraceae bacterium]
MNYKFSIKQILHTAVIASIYVVLSAVFAPLSFGAVQVRISEALTLLPLLTPLAIPGLFIGCLLANLLFSGSILDICLGSLATLIAAVITRHLRRHKYLAALPPVIVNGFIIAYVLKVSIGAPYWLTVFTVGVGQAISCYALGIPLITFLQNHFPKNFFDA